MDVPFSNVSSQKTLERWQIFTFYQQHRGFTQERTSALGDAGDFICFSLTTFQMPGEDSARHESPFLFTYRRDANGSAQLTSFGYFRIEHDQSFYTVYLLTTERLLKIEGDCLIDERSGTFPADVCSSAAFTLLVERLKPEVGSQIHFTAAQEGDGQIQGSARLEITHHEDVQTDLQGTRQRLWRVQELIDERPARRFWIDERGESRVFDWGGPVSYAVADRGAARQGLPGDWRTLDDCGLPTRFPCH